MDNHTCSVDRTTTCTQCLSEELVALQGFGVVVVEPDGQMHLFDLSEFTDAEVMDDES